MWWNCKVTLKDPSNVHIFPQPRQKAFRNDFFMRLFVCIHKKSSSSGIMDKDCGFESHLVDEQYLPFQQYSCSAVVKRPVPMSHLLIVQLYTIMNFRCSIFSIYSTIHMFTLYKSRLSTVWFFSITFEWRICLVLNLLANINYSEDSLNKIITFFIYLIIIKYSLLYTLSALWVHWDADLGISRRVKRRSSSFLGGIK